MPCNGNGADHCCWVRGKPCAELVEYDPRAPERRWACGIMLDLHDWDKVIASDRYKEATGDAWVDGLNCKDWPDGEGANRGYCEDPSCRVPLREVAK